MWNGVVVNTLGYQYVGPGLRFPLRPGCRDIGNDFRVTDMASDPVRFLSNFLRFSSIASDQVDMRQIMGNQKQNLLQLDIQETTFKICTPGRTITRS